MNAAVRPGEIERELVLPSVSLNTHVVSRCNRWGVYILYQHRSGAVHNCGPKHVVSWWGPLVQNPNVASHSRDPHQQGTPAGIDLTEVLETAEAIRRLGEPYRLTVTLEHTARGNQQAKAEFCGVSQPTFSRRLQVSYGFLLGLMNDVAAGL